jgi:hypothetical protein
MWLINQKLQGVDPPPALTPEMVPPSFRTKPPVDGVIVSTACFFPSFFYPPTQIMFYLGFGLIDVSSTNFIGSVL